MGHPRRAGARALHRAAPVARQDPGARSHRPGDRRRHPLPRALDVERLRPVRRRGAGRGHRDGHRHRPWRAVRVHRQRRHGQGRLAAPRLDQEARARPGDRRAEPPRRDLPGGLGRRVPAAPGRDLPRQGPLRRLVLPPGAHVGHGTPPALGGARRLHRGRRLRPGAVGRGDHGGRHRSHLSRRPAHREGRPGRDHRARRPGRRRAAHPHVGRERLPGERRARGLRQAARDLQHHQPAPHRRAPGVDGLGRARAAGP